MIKVGGQDAETFLGSKRSPIVVMNDGSYGPKEVFPIGTYKNVQTGFDGEIDLGKFPISYMTESNMLGGVVSGGLYTPRATNVAAKQTRLADQTFNGSEITIEVVPALISTLDRPASIIVGGNLYGYYPIEVIFGSNGSRIEFTDYLNVKHVVSSKTHTINNGDVIRVKRLMNVVVVYVNGIYVHSGGHPDMAPDAGRTYVGFATTSGPGWVSTSFNSFNAVGSTTDNPEIIAHYDIERIQAPSSGGNAGRFYVRQGGPCTIYFNEFRWTTTTSFSQREGHVNVNGDRKIFIGSQNGGDGYVDLNLAPNSLITITTWCVNAGANDRWIKSGYVDIYGY
ncbi:hypothetical protein SEA_SCHWARTZ33_30 [Gordonia phage Schwartz33]|nr:hypothetical protein SEA_SCHWARTZ33_30 [Gordonia phage Schwartz33]